MRSFLYFIGSRFLSGEKGEKGDKGDQGEPGGTFSKSQMLEMFYPIGSYYETTDTTFDPNVEWTGVWVLEDEGLVHISSGTNYNVSVNDKDGGNSTINYTPSGRNDPVTLTANQSGVQSHAHTFQAKTTGSWSNVQWGPWYTSGSNRGGINWGLSGATGSVQITSTSKNAVESHNHGFTGTQATLNVMQPYKIVNRWHRTA